MSPPSCCTRPARQSASTVTMARLVGGDTQSPWGRSAIAALQKVTRVFESDSTPAVRAARGSAVRRCGWPLGTALDPEPRRLLHVRRHLERPGRAVAVVVGLEHLGGQRVAAAVAGAEPRRRPRSSSAGERTPLRRPAPPREAADRPPSPRTADEPAGELVGALVVVDRLLAVDERGDVARRRAGRADRRRRAGRAPARAARGGARRSRSR